MHAPGENKESTKGYSESRGSSRPLVLKKASLGWLLGRDQNAMREWALCSSRPSSSWIMCAKSHSFLLTELDYIMPTVLYLAFSTQQWIIDIFPVSVCVEPSYSFVSVRLVYHNMYHNLNICIFSDNFSFFLLIEFIWMTLINKII